MKFIKRISVIAAICLSLVAYGVEKTDTNGEIVPTQAITSFATRYATSVETWDKDTIDHKLGEIKRFSSPFLISYFDSYFSGLAPAVKSNQLARTGNVRNSVVISNVDGKYIVGILMDMTGSIGDGDKKTVTDEYIKVIRIIIVKNLVTDRNPEGLYVLEYAPMRGHEWVERGLPPFWEGPKADKSAEPTK